MPSTIFGDLLPHINSNQKAFIEITNPEHGGAGWELGSTLWSPVYSNKHNKENKTKTWQIMEQVKPGDLIVHLVKLKNGYHWTGISFAASSISTVNDEPPKPSKWAGMSPYQRISLEQYAQLEKAFPIDDFFNAYCEELATRYEKGGFYVLYGETKELRIAQRYFAYCPPWLLQLFSTQAGKIGFQPYYYDSSSHIPTSNEPSYSDYSAPGRVETSVSRLIRDTDLSRKVKKENDWICQICSLQINLPNKQLYAEGHHIRPLGGVHEGPDIKENILILCPNHHAEFDYGSIAINPVTKRIVHIDDSNPFHDRQLAYHRGDLATEFLEYHFENIFRKEFSGGNKT